MSKDKKKDEFCQRKDCRRQHLQNKNRDKKERFDDEISCSKNKKETKKKIEDLRQEEIWEDWEEYGR